MLASDKHRVRALAIKKRLREIEAVDDLTDEIRSESTTLQTELVDVETREAAALASEPDPDERIVTEDSEDRERREVRNRTGFRDYPDRRVQRRPGDRRGCRVQRGVRRCGR